jgi:hypothetical protein
MERARGRENAILSEFVMLFQSLTEKEDTAYDSDIDGMPLIV